MELHIPVDFERLPEFRVLVSSLAAYVPKRGVNPAVGAALLKDVEQAATFIWMRLWVELSYLAQTTNRAGLLTDQGARLFENSLEPLFGDDCRPIHLLEASNCIRKEGENNFFCDRFAKYNPHLSGNFKSREVKGAYASALERNKHNLAREANQQAMLLPPEIFKRKDGSPLEPGLVQQCMLAIKTLDNCLQHFGRKTGDYTEGMIADAADMTQKYKPEELRKFYLWLCTNRGHPAVPTTTEQVLAEFENYFQMSRG